MERYSEISSNKLSKSATPKQRSITMDQFIDPQTKEEFEAWLNIIDRGRSPDRVLEDMKDFFETLPVPVRYGGGGYSYTIDPEDPTKATASDGDPVQMRSVMHLKAWTSDQLWDDLFDEEASAFRSGQIDQEQHELDQLRGD